MMLRQCPGLFIQPLDEVSCDVHSFVLVIDETSTDVDMLHFQQMIFLQDRSILENQVPARVPLEPGREYAVRADATSMAYRRWLRDAQAILVYLAGRYDAARRWYPTDPALQGRIAMWLSFAGGEIMNSSAARLHDMLGYDFDIERARAAAHDAFRVLDDHLTDQGIRGHGWIVDGSHPTIADIACFPYVALAGDGGITIEDYGAIRLWLERVKRLPGFRVMPGIHPAG